MSTNHLLFCLHPFSPALNPLSFHVLGWARGLSSFSVFPPSCWRGMFEWTAAGEEWSKTLHSEICLQLKAFGFSSSPLPPWAWSPGFCLSWHISTLRNIPAVPVTQCPPVTMLRWGTLTHTVSYTSTSSQVRFLNEMPRGKLSHLTSWHAGSHKLRAHTPCFSSKERQQSHHRAAHRSQLPAARWVQTRLCQYRELHTGLSLFLPTTETIIAPVVKKKQYLWGILVSIATLIYMFYYTTN